MNEINTDIAAENAPEENNGEPVAVTPPADNTQFQLPDRPAGLTNTEWFTQLADNQGYLHNALSAVAPIDGLSGGDQDIRSYRISFKAEATEEQRAAAHALLLELPGKLRRVRAREAAIAELDKWFNTQIDAGFHASNGLQLGLKTEDVTLLTGNFIMAQQAALIGMPLPPIVDMNGTTYSFASVDKLTQTMLEYGRYRANLTANYAAQKAEIDAQFADPPTPVAE